MAKNRPYLKYLLWTIILISTITLVFSSSRQIERLKSQKVLNEFTENIEKPTVLKEPSIEEKVYSLEINPQKEWLDVNEDYQGWLFIEGTNIDYPTVRARDNYFYLDKDFLKNKNELGAIFMDYRNVGNFNDRHTAIYGHFTWNGKMFADLHKYKGEKFGIENNTIKFNTLYGEKEFQIFSVYVDSAADYILELDFKDDFHYENYLKKLQELSLYEIPTDLSGDKLLLTLATCSYEIGDGRLIVHGIEK